MKVSVAMTTYNGEDYIIPQLDSLRRQIKAIDELLIYDDGSKDNTCQIIQEYIDKYHLINWKIYTNKTNLGFVGNFFQAIEQTTGDLIFLCDQDDIWEETKISDMMAQIEKNPDIVVLNTAVRLIDKDGKKIKESLENDTLNANILLKKIERGALEKFDFMYLSMANVSPGCTMCFRAELKKYLNKVKTLAIELKFPHDWCINMLGAACYNGTYFWNERLTNYRIHDNNTIGLDLEKKEEEREIHGIKSTKELRIQYAIEMAQMKEIAYKINQLCKNDPKINKLYFCAKKRVNLMEHLNIVNYLRLFQYWKEYKILVGNKGIISDGIYALHLDNIFRK